MLQLNRYRGLAFIALWQTAPVVVNQDSTGRVQIHFAAGGGQYENVVTSCEGDVLDAQSLGYSGAGGGGQLWLNDWARVNAFANVLAAEEPSMDDAWGDVTELDGTSVGAMLALEFRYFGAGLGGVVSSSDPLPLPYLRIGSIDGVHLRGDLMATDGTGTMNGIGRLGLGYNQGHLRGTRAFVGLTACHAACEGEAGLGFLEISTPIAEQWDLRAAGLWGPGIRNSEMGLTVGITWLPEAARIAPPAPIPAPAAPVPAPIPPPAPVLPRVPVPVPAPVPGQPLLPPQREAFGTRPDIQAIRGAAFGLQRDRM